METPIDLFTASHQEEEQRRELARLSNFELSHVNEYFENCVVLGKLDPVVGNYETRVTTLLAYGLGGISVLIRGEAGTGKSLIMNATSALYWGDGVFTNEVDDVYTIDESSEKGLLTEEEAVKVEEAKRCFIPELQNVKVLVPMVKKWCEGKPYVYKRQRPGRFYTEEITLYPLPILTNLAEGNERMPVLGHEMKRRFLNLWTTNSLQQNEAIIRRKALMKQLKSHQIRTMSDDEIRLLRAYLLNAVELDVEMVVNPCSVEMSKYIPKKYVVSNSYADYFFDIIESVSKFYYNRNMTKDGVLFSSPRDNKLAWIVSGSQMIDTCLGIPFGVGRFIIDQLPVVTEYGGLSQDTRDLGLNVGQMADIMDNEGRAMEVDVLTTTLDKLVTANFIKQDRVSKKYYRSVEAQKESDINWSRVVDVASTFMQMNYPDYAEEYERLFCRGDGLEYIHPFTGVKMSLINDEKIRDDVEDDFLNELDELFPDLSLNAIEHAVNYFKLHETIPRLFFVEEVTRQIGFVDREALGQLFDHLVSEGVTL